MHSELHKVQTGIGAAQGTRFKARGKLSVVKYRFYSSALSLAPCTVRHFLFRQQREIPHRQKNRQGKKAHHRCQPDGQQRADRFG